MTQIKQPLPFIVEHGLGMLHKRLMEKRGERGEGITKCWTKLSD